MKVLYFANVAAEYRIPFFNELNKKVDIDFIITRQSINKKIYNFGNGTKLNENITFLSEKKIKHYKQLIDILIKREYDLCVVPPLDSLEEMVDAIIIATISKLRKKKNIYFWEKWQPDEIYIPSKKKIKNLLQKYAYKLIDPIIDKILVPGKKSYRYFIEYIKCRPDKIGYILNASTIVNKNNILNIRKKYKIDENKFIILYFGRIVKFKGLDILIKAISQVNNKEVVLLICGDGEYRIECEKLVKQLKLKNIIFTGAINSNERHNYFKESNLFVLPSRIYNGGIEAWGLTVNEAMDMELPCIVSNSVGCSNEIIHNNYNGLIFRSDDYYDLSSKIKLIINDQEFTKSIAKNAKETVINKYNYQNMANSFIEQFISL